MKFGGQIVLEAELCPIRYGQLFRFGIFLDPQVELDFELELDSQSGFYVL